jgi:glycosyltransferase involved in cell wall biosynthesis
MKSKELPLVSVVVPSYQQGRFIENTLLSILNQNYKNTEVIVVDGGSIDNTLVVLKRYENRITYISEPDNGQSEAINKGFSIARGEIVSWLNSDDIYPDCRAISWIVDAFKLHPEYDLIYGNFIEIDNFNRVLRMYKRPGYSFSRLLRIGYISQPATFFRRRVIDAMPVKEDLNYAMDLEYWLRAHRLKFRFSHVNSLIAAERLHEDAKCVKSTNLMAREARTVRMQYGARFTRMFPLYRFIDRLFLYACRISAIGVLFSYRRHPGYLAIPLSFDGALIRTIMFRKT